MPGTEFGYGLHMVLRMAGTELEYGWHMVLRMAGTEAGYGGTEVWMVTGDNAVTAGAVARSGGFGCRLWRNCYEHTGVLLEQWDAGRWGKGGCCYTVRYDEYNSMLIPYATMSMLILYITTDSTAEVKPADKVERVKALQAQ
eukprot:1795674-Rhodomonas_salina.2